MFMNTFDGWNDELYHHGIRGQKWGIRKYQNPDGTLTEEGKARYGYGGTANVRQRAKFLNKLDQKIAHNLVKMDQAKKPTKFHKYGDYINKTRESVKSILDGAEKEGMKIKQTKTLRTTTTGKTLVKGVLAAAATTALIDLATTAALGTKTSYYHNGVNHVTINRPSVKGPMLPFVPSAIAGGVIGAGITKYKKGTKYKVEKNTNKNT